MKIKPTDFRFLLFFCIMGKDIWANSSSNYISPIKLKNYISLINDVHIFLSLLIHLIKWSLSTFALNLKVRVQPRC